MEILRWSVGLILITSFSASNVLALGRNSRPKEVLNEVAPKNLALVVVPHDFQFNSPKHKHKTLDSWRGNLSHVGDEDLIICAIEKKSDSEWDGYLVFANFAKGRWRLTQLEKFPSVSGPSLKDFSGRGYLLFFASFAGDEPPKKIAWNATKSKFELTEAETKAIEK